MAAMIRAVFFRDSIETAVLILPVATMIAFSQLRGSFPNAPTGFGKPLFHSAIRTLCPYKNSQVPI
jgi:hypothetical protein